MTGIRSSSSTQATALQQRALDNAERLVSAGDFASALRLLETTNREQPCALIEQQLIDLRISSFERLSWPEPGTVDHGCGDNRFKDGSGLPEIDFSDLDSEALRAGILGRGGLIVRGLMKPGLAERMRDNIDYTLEARRVFAASGGKEETSPWFFRSPLTGGGPVQFDTIGRNQSTNTGSVWSVFSPATAFQLIEFYREIGLPGMLREYFGEASVLSVKKWVLRCIAPNNGAASGWHQDGKFLGDSRIRTVNLWVALNACGGDADAPGLEIVPGGDHEIYQTGTHGADFDWTVGQGLVDEVAKVNPVQCPRFEVGDAIFFDHYNLHRTAFGLDHVRTRYAVESWFFAASTAPGKQQPLVFDY